MDEYTLQDLFEAFVFIRRQGGTPDNALSELHRLRKGLSQEERSELAHLIRQWEKTEGATHSPDPDHQITPTPFPISSSPMLLKECPRCHRTQSSTAIYCYYCGTLLTRTGTPFVLYDPESIQSLTFTSQSLLVFTIRGHEENPIRTFVPSRQAIIIGRASEDGVLIPDIDLSRYDAQSYGVSRAHAAIHRKGKGITILDMGSLNYTFLNGERVFPQEDRLLSSGSELRLGRMVMSITFEFLRQDTK